MFHYSNELFKLLELQGRFQREPGAFTVKPRVKDRHKRRCHDLPCRLYVQVDLYTTGISSIYMAPPRELITVTVSMKGGRLQNLGR